MNRFPTLFSPARFGGLEVPNRVVFAATSSELGDADGFLGDAGIEYYVERARGGVGLIVVEATYVEKEGVRLVKNVMVHDDRYIPQLRKLTDAVHREGARIALQLAHGGREAVQKVSGSVPLAPSAIPSQFIGFDRGVVPKQLTIPEIERIVQRFVDAAVRAKKAGFDAVELHGAHGYLISQFFSPSANHRTDRYGGDVAGRARFCVEIVQGIRRTLGDYPVIVRMNGSDYSPGGLELDDACRIAELLEEAGADALSVSGGVHSSRPYRIIPGMAVERNCFSAETAAIRRTVSIPIMCVGRIKTPEMAEEILARGDADFICLSRALLADPAFAAKAREGVPEQIAPCIACNECLANTYYQEGIACTVNPFVGREYEFKKILMTKVPRKKVAVIGSGAAGLAAAITAATKGHEVHVFERQSHVGGQLRLASTPPNREEIGTLLEYYVRELARLQVPVHLNREIPASELEEQGFDTVVIATGARPVKPKVPGADLPHVMSGWECLTGAREAGHRCVVVGGGLVGIEVADHLAEHGRQVTLVARSELLKKAVHADFVHFTDRIASLGIEVLTHTDILSVGPDSVEIQPKGRLRRTLHGVDTVVFCLGYESRRDEAQQYLGRRYDVHFVGDVAGPRKFFEAIKEGTLEAATL